MSQQPEGRLTVCIDFDGVIHRYTLGDWREGEVYGPPIEGAIDSLFRLKDRGWNVVIHTTRGRSEKMREDIRQWLALYGSSYAYASGRFDVWLRTKLKKDFPFIITNKKLPAIAYIDDRAIRFTNWEDIVRYFS